MNANPTWLYGFFTPSTNGRFAVTIGDTNRTEIPDVVAMFNPVYAGTLTATRTITYPPPSDGTDATAYVKALSNTTNQSLTFTTGSGATVTIATGKTALLQFSTIGVTRFTPDT